MLEVATLLIDRVITGPAKGGADASGGVGGVIGVVRGVCLDVAVVDYCGALIDLITSVLHSREHSASTGDARATSMTTEESSAINRLFQNVTLTPPSCSLPPSSVM